MTSLGANLGAAMPFLGVLASFALLPGLAPRFWHRRMTWIILGWVALDLIIVSAQSGPLSAWTGLWRGGVAEFLPFIALLMALYALGGGILIAGGPWGRPGGNVLLLGIATLLAGIMGTIGATLLFIHPLLAANGGRAERRHLVIAFIILVSNAGGALSPLGDPPLLVGFLKGVPFLWPVKYLTLPFLVLAVPVLALCYAFDARLARRAPVPVIKPLRIRGGFNIALLVLFVPAIAAAGIWQGPGLALWRASLPASQVALTALALAFILLSQRFTPRAIRVRNRFAWEPMREIALLFFAIFTTIGPVLHLLASTGISAAHPALWFWLAGLCSAFLDSAPTYLIFFHAAGGNARHLAAAPSRLLTAMSAGAVFFGALTYLGNAPNLMVRAIAARAGVRMPGFLSYMVLAGAVLLPLYLIQTAIFFR